MLAPAVIAWLLRSGCGSAPGGAATGARRPIELVVPHPEVNRNAAVWRTPLPPTEPQAGDVWVDARLAMKFVYVPAGDFTLGASDAQIARWLRQHPDDRARWFRDEQPQRQAHTSAYWIGQTEVTNGQYVKFVRASGYGRPDYLAKGRVPTGMGSLPVDRLRWEDAAAYCKWAGLRLPTETEWEKAARGTDGREFPWGSTWDITRCRNFGSLTGRTFDTMEEWGQAETEWTRRHPEVGAGLAAVGSYPSGASPYGCMDMAGNVFEWCADMYNEEGYGASEGSSRQGDSREGYYHVFRGGAWQYGTPFVFRCGTRTPHWPAKGGVGYGFRCIRDAR